jgi:hypothetical protein
VINKIVIKFKKAIELFDEFKNTNNILIYQMGKVGSTSLEASLPGSIHTHTLFGNYFLPKDAKLGRNGEGFLGWLQMCGEDLIKRYAIKKRKNIKIITLIRNPIDRDVSMFFQDLPEWLVYHKKLHKYDARLENSSMLNDVFNLTYDASFGLEWFDKELKRFTDIDIYDYEYEQDKGFLKITKGKYEILLIEMNKINAVEGVLSDFSGLDVNVSQGNRGEAKWYGDAYKSFKTDFKPSAEYLSAVNSSKFYTHFYKEE